VFPAPAVRVNEFMTGTAASASDEFVEIVNAGDAIARLGGYQLVYRAASGTSDVVLATLPAGASIPAGGRYLFAGSGYTGSPLPDQTFTHAVASTGGGIGLRDAQGALVDSVGYGTAANDFVEGSSAPAPPQADAPGASASRIPDGADTNDNALDFSVTRPPTPGAPNS